MTIIDSMKTIDLTSPALLIIDMQRYFLDPEADAFLEDAPAIIPNVISLIDGFRSAKLPIIYTRHAHRKGDPTGEMGRWWNEKLPWEGDWQSELIIQLKPAHEEPVIVKTRYSAFMNTDLETHLRKKDVRGIVLCGVLTHLCVETTARHAFMLNFQPIIVSDACASESKAHHEAALLNLAHGFAYVCEIETIIHSLSP